VCETTSHIGRVARLSLRERIVSTALTEFHRRGFASCSVDTITKAAGVPKGSFYNHFASKEALGVEVLSRYASESGWRDGLDAEIISPLAQLRARFQLMAEVLVANEFTRGCLLGTMGAEQADHSPAIRAQVNVSLNNWSDNIAESLRAAQVRGELSADLDAEQLGRFVLNAWQGALLRAKVTKNSVPIDDFFSIIFDHLLRRPAHPAE
jgi:TetR/AcrR family transcriptional regulator, transcriptional repressor for nem operon